MHGESPYLIMFGNVAEYTVGTAGNAEMFHQAVVHNTKVCVNFNRT